MANVLLTGVSKEMAQETLRKIKDSKDLTVVAGFDRVENNSLGFPVHTTKSSLASLSMYRHSAGYPDIIIDYLHGRDIADFASLNRIPLVVITSNQSDSHLAWYIRASARIPIFVIDNERALTAVRYLLKKINDVHLDSGYFTEKNLSE